MISSTKKKNTSHKQNTLQTVIIRAPIIIIDCSICVLFWAPTSDFCNTKMPFSYSACHTIWCPRLPLRLLPPLLSCPETLVPWRSLFFLDFSYLFLERGYGREKKREINMDVKEKHRLVASRTHTPSRLNVQPAHMPWRETQPVVTFHFAGRCPASWASPASGRISFLTSILKASLSIVSVLTVFKQAQTALHLEKKKKKKKEQKDPTVPSSRCHTFISFSLPNCLHLLSLLLHYPFTT